MREEITEPKHWRTAGERQTQRNSSWTARRRTQDHSELVAEAVDAAFAEEAIVTESDKSDTQGSLSTGSTSADGLDSKDIIASLADQLELLEQQREQIQRLLEQAQGK